MLAEGCWQILFSIQTTPIMTGPVGCTSTPPGMSGLAPPVLLVDCMPMVLVVHGLVFLLTLHLQAPRKVSSLMLEEACQTIRSEFANDWEGLNILLCEATAMWASGHQLQVTNST